MMAKKAIVNGDVALVKEFGAFVTIDANLCGDVIWGRPGSELGRRRVALEVVLWHLLESK